MSLRLLVGPLSRNSNMLEQKAREIKRTREPDQQYGIEFDQEGARAAMGAGEPAESSQCIERKPSLDHESGDELRVTIQSMIDAQFNRGFRPPATWKQG